MTFSNEEIDLILESRAFNDRLLEAKENKEDDPEEYRAAKDALRAFRQQWRGVRDYVKAQQAQDQQNAIAEAKAITAQVENN